MRRHSNRSSKQWTVEVEAWGAAHARTAARTAAKAVEKEIRDWGREEAHAHAHVQRRMQAQAQAEVQAQVAVTAPPGADGWLWWQFNNDPEKVEALVSVIALELAEVHKAVGVWMQRQGQPRRQLQAWLSVCEAYQVEKRARTRTSVPGFGLEWHHDLWAEFAGFPREDARERYLWLRRQRNYWWLIQIITPINRLPPELLQQILLLVFDNVRGPPIVLMRVCKYWYNIVTGIWALLKLGTRTSEYDITSKLGRNQWLLDVVIDTEMDRLRLIPMPNAYQAIFAAMQETSRWRSLVVDTSPAPAEFPEDLIDRGLQQCSDPVMNRLRTLIIECPCEMSPLLEYLLRILGTSASGELTTVEIRSADVISFLVPTYPSIFRSVTVLTLDAPLRLDNPVDLLSHLHRLEALTASHFPLPVYYDDVDLPFVHTLRHLTLRSISIQWMSGRTFHVLESCTLILPLHRHVLHTFCTTLPNCKHLSFEGYPLDILRGVSAHNLTHLSVKCSSSYRPRGNRQLARFSSQALEEGRLAPQILHISIEAMDHAWTKALAFMSNLEELAIYNARPSSLGATALQSLVVQTLDANHIGTTATHGRRDTLICPSLRRFGLRYLRWLRPSEHFDLIPVFISIIRSREQSMLPMQNFRIWTRSCQKYPVELIEGSSISLKGFERLKEYARITG